MKLIKTKTPKRYLPGPQVAARYDVTDMSIYRWERDPRLNFPAPIRIGRRKFWAEDDLEAWEHANTRAPGDGEAA